MTDKAKHLVEHTKWTTFSSANDGLDPVFRTESRALGYFIGQNGFDYYYGGDLCGLMGEVFHGVKQARDEQDPASDKRSRIIAVPYHIYYKQELDPHFCEVHVKESLREQQFMLQDSAQHLAALPGGIGTRAEIWNTIEDLRCNPAYSEKHLWLINVKDSYKYFLQDIQEMLQNKTAKEADFSRVHMVTCVDELKERLHEPPRLTF